MRIIPALEQFEEIGTPERGTSAWLDCERKTDRHIPLDERREVPSPIGDSGRMIICAAEAAASVRSGEERGHA